MDDKTPSTLAMHTLLLCTDAQFLGITRNVLSQLHVTPKIASGSDAAQAMIHFHAFEVIIMDWREIDNVADFLCAVRRSKQNADCVLVAIVRDLLDLRQAFAAGVHFLIHKPASAVQIERCLRAAYCATVARSPGPICWIAPGWRLITFLPSRRNFWLELFCNLMLTF